MEGPWLHQIHGKASPPGSSAPGHIFTLVSIYLTEIDIQNALHHLYSPDFEVLNTCSRVNLLRKADDLLRHHSEVSYCVWELMTWSMRKCEQLSVSAEWIVSLEHISIYSVAVSGCRDRSWLGLALLVEIEALNTQF